MDPEKTTYFKTTSTIPPFCQTGRNKPCGEGIMHTSVTISETYQAAIVTQMISKEIVALWNATPCEKYEFDAAYDSALVILNTLNKE